MLGEDDEQLSWFPSASNSRRSVQVRYPMMNDFSVTEGGGGHIGQLHPKNEAMQNTKKENSD